MNATREEGWPERLTVNIHRIRSHNVVTSISLSLSPSLSLDPKLLFLRVTYTFVYLSVIESENHRNHVEWYMFLYIQRVTYISILDYTSLDAAQRCVSNSLTPYAILSLQSYYNGRNEFRNIWKIKDEQNRLKNLICRITEILLNGRNFCFQQYYCWIKQFHVWSATFCWRSLRICFFNQWN